MSFTLGPLNIVAGTATSITFPGDIGAIAYVKIANASPLTVQLTNLGPGQDWLQPMEVNVWPMTGVTGAVSVNPTADLSGVTSGISALFVTCYLAGEQGPAGNYPGNLGLLTYVGNVVNTMPSETPADTIEQDLLTPFVLIGLTVTGLGGSLQVGPGVAYLRQADSSLLRVAPSGFAGGSPGANKTVFLDLNPDGTFSFGTSHSSQPNYLTICTATTNALAIFNSSTDTRVLNTTFLSGAQEIDTTGNFVVGSNLTVDAGATLSSTLGVTGATTLHSGLAVTGANTTLDAGAISTNGSGALFAVSVTAPTVTVNAPPTLATGHQETGYVGIQFKAAAANDTFGVGVNFKTLMTNVPSSISLSSITSSNAAGPTAAHITAQGFFFGITASAGGAGFWVGTYTTVGN